MQFEFATASRVVFGRNTATRLPHLVRSLGSNALFVTGRHPERNQGLMKAVEQTGCQVTIFPLTTEPTVDDIRRGTSVARTCGADVVVGLGGGSAVDAGKAIAAMARQPHDLLHYLEIIGQGQPLEEPSLPFVAVPTTAATGAEATRNAVLASPEHGIKASLRHPSMLPVAALVDPALATGCPPAVTAAGGMDALTQCLEAYVSCRAQPMTDLLCADGIRRAVRSLERAVQDGSDLAAREDLALAALYSGMALANAGLGAVHGFAAPIGGSFKAAHGAVCAALLAPVWKANWQAVKTRGNAENRARFTQAARWLLADDSATPEDATGWLRALSRRLKIPGLASLGLRNEHLDELVEKAAQASSMKGNPVPLKAEELRSILQDAL